MVNLRAVSSLRGVCCAFQTGYQGITPISLLTKRSQVVIPAASKVVLFSSKRESISRGGIQSTTWEYLPKPYLYQIAGTKGSVTRDLGRRFSSTPSSPGGGGNVEDIAKDPNKESQGKMGKLKYAIRQYGPVAIVTYLGVYVTTLGLLYVAIESGVNPFDYGMGDSGSLLNKVTHTLEGYSWTEPLLEAIEKNPHVGNFALAWILTKFTEPARLLLTLAVVPRIARALGRVPPSV